MNQNRNKPSYDPTQWHDHDQHCQKNKKNRRYLDVNAYSTHD